METTRLGTSDLKVTRLGMGGCPLGGHGWGKVSDYDSIRAVQTALDAGITFFDTADVYGLGHSEQILSSALGDSRHHVAIATKFGVRWNADGQIVKDISPTYLRQALEDSLERLRIDSIPLYYVHWPDGNTPVEAAIEELAKCRDQGKIQAIGVSNFSVDDLRRASAVTDIACIQLQLSLIHRKALSYSTALAETNTSLVTWGSLAQGLLSGKYTVDSQFASGDRRNRYEDFSADKLKENLKIVEIVKQIARRVKKKPAQVAMRWLLDSPCVGSVLFGAKSSQQVLDNVGADGWSLTPQEHALLSSTSELAAA